MWGFGSPRFARGTMWGFGSRASRGEPERLGSPCGQGEPQGGGSTAAPRLTVRAPRLRIRARRTADRAPRLRVRARRTADRAPRLRVRARRTADRAPRLRIRARRTADRAPRLRVRARRTAVHRRRFCPVGLHGMPPHSGWNSNRLMMTSTSRPSVGGVPSSSHRFMRGVSSPGGGYETARVSPLGDDCARAGRLRAMPPHAAKIEPPWLPAEPVYRLAHARGPYEGVLGVSRVVRADGVVAVGSRRALKPRELDVDFAVAEVARVAPSEQPQHDLRVKRMHLAVEVEAVGSVAQRAGADDLGALPAAACARDFQVQSPARVHPHIALGVREEVRSRTDGRRVAFDAPSVA
jgi:hypothetical protein